MAMSRKINIGLHHFLSRPRTTQLAWWIQKGNRAAKGNAVKRQDFLPVRIQVSARGVTWLRHERDEIA